MRTVKIPGTKKRHNVLLYAISTCAWCKRTKRFLADHSIQYEYIDVDLCNKEDRRKIREDILTRGGRLSYPTLIVDDKVLITGFHEDQIRQVLDIE